MAEESFLLVSLREEKAKKLAQVINNDTCRKILDHLAEAKEGTESSIAKALNLPISTVHYNIRHLLENKLVTVDEFHYSEKGKEVNHYRLANRLIIISQSEDESFLERLRKVLPLGLIALIGSGLVFTVTKTWNRSYMSAQFAEKAVRDTIAESAASIPAAEPFSAAIFPDPLQIALWFLAGAIFIIVLSLLWKRRRAKK